MSKLFVSVFALTSVGTVSATSSAIAASDAEKSGTAEEKQSSQGETINLDKTDTSLSEKKKSEKQPENKGFSALQIDSGRSSFAVSPNQDEASESPKNSENSGNSEVSGVSEIPEFSDKEPDKADSDSDKASTALDNGNGLRLNEVKAADFFKTPNAFASCLEPGHWYEVPQASGDSWCGSLLVTKETLTQLLEKKSAELAQKLVSKELLGSKAFDDKAFRDTVLEALDGLTHFDEATKKDLERVKLCELTTFSEFLKARKLERFDKGDEVFERPRVGIPVKYSKGKVVIDSKMLRQVFEKRFEVANKITEIAEKEIDFISADRDRMISAKSKKKLGEIQQIADENEQLQKKIDAEKGKHADEIAKLENDLKTTLANNLKQAEAMPTTVTTWSGKKSYQSTNTARQPAIDAARKARDDAEAKLKELSAGYAEFEQKIKENEGKIEELEQDNSIKSARVMEAVFNERYEEPIGKVKDNFDRLSVLDPSKITATELKAKKISKEVRDQIAELAKLEKQNKELYEKINAEKSKNKDEIEKAETDMKTGEKELADAERIPQTTSQRSGNRYITVTNTAYTNAKSSANQKIAAAKKKLEELTKGYAEFEKQAKENDEQIKQIKANENVMSAKKILEDLEKERRMKREEE